MTHAMHPRSAQKIQSVQPSTGAVLLLPESGAHAVAAPAVGGKRVAEPSARTTTGLLRFLLLLLVISGLTCLYAWQAEMISSVRSETVELRRAIGALERENAGLILEYAQWDAPGYIEAEARKSGMVIGQVPVRVRVPGSADHQTAARTADLPDVPFDQLAAWLSPSLMSGSQNR